MHSALSGGEVVVETEVAVTVVGETAASGVADETAEQDAPVAVVLQAIPVAQFMSSQ